MCCDALWVLIMGTRSGAKANHILQIEKYIEKAPAESAIW
jgi:hypothetical protein